MANRTTKLIFGTGLAIIALLAALMILAGPVIAADQCVIPGGGSGCFTTIQAAINAASNGDTVKVMAGTYNENVVITKNLILLGGFNNTSFTTRTPRTSIINGVQSNSVVRIADGAVVTIDGFTITGGNATANNGQGGGISIREATAIIRNNLITGNVACTARGSEGHGGGIFVTASTGPVGIYNNLIQANAAHSLTLASAVAISSSMGGGILIGDTSSAIITGNQVLSNVALQANRRPLDAWAGGGGIVWWGNEMTLSSNTIQGNVANAIGGNGDGGGLGLWGQVATVTNNTIAQNTANVAGTYGSGGGVVAGSLLQRLTLNNNWVLSNTAVIAAASTATPQSTWVGGGGISIDGSTTSADRLTIQDNHIIGNVAARTMTTSGANSYGQVVGGGLNIGHISTTLILNNEIRGNMVVENLSLSGNGSEGGSNGGGLHLSNNDTVTISNNQILENVTARQQTVNGTSSSSGGGGLALFSTAVTTISANTISGNVAVITGSTTGSASGNHSYGGGGMDIDGYDVPNDRLSVANNHIIGNVAIRKMTTGVGYTGYTNGGGLNVRNMTTTLILNNEVRGNTAAENFSLSGSGGGGGGNPSGGGISLGDNDTVTISNNQILDNVAARQQMVNQASFATLGGGLALHNTANATVNANTVAGNVTVVAGSITSNTDVDYDARGGGIMVACWGRPGCALSLVSNQILNNTTVQSVTVIGSVTGSGTDGGGLSLEANTALIQGNVISGNIAALAGDGNGGGIEARFSTITMQMNRLLGNRASLNGVGGPAVWVGESLLTSVNDIFARNTSGGIGVATAGPAVRVTVINDTFHNNDGVGIEAYGPASTVYVTNTIISGHDDGLRLNDPASTLRGNYNLLNNAINFSGGATGGPNDILNLDPLFVNAPKDNFRLASGSPAIDKGTSVGAPGVDFEGGSRPFGSRVDIGADEYGVGGGPSIYLPIIRK